MTITHGEPVPAAPDADELSTRAREPLAVSLGLAPGRAPLTSAGGARTRPPLRLAPAVLLDLAAAYAADVAPSTGPRAARSYELLELTDDFEVWAIRWPAGGRLELHDHGGSSGALWVVRGSLHESSPTPNGVLRRRRVKKSTGIAFEPDHIHDVVNAGGKPAVSVHVYAPPMPAMTYYRQCPGGFVATRTEYRDEPSWAP